MADIRIGRMVLGVCQTNTYFVYREGCKEANCIDPAEKGEQIFIDTEYDTCHTNLLSFLL